MSGFTTLAIERTYGKLDRKIWILDYVSDLLENVVSVVDGSSFRKLWMKSSLVKSTKCEHVFDAFDPYHCFPSSLGAIILTKVSSVGMMKCTIHLFSFWLTRTGVLERANRSDKKIDSPFSSLCYCWSFHCCWSEFE
jgi:hypothetical protein